MSKCKYCGFDSENDSIYAEGAPCGVPYKVHYNGYGDDEICCKVFTCCQDTWKEHCKKAHKEYYKKHLGHRPDFEHFLVRQTFKLKRIYYGIRYGKEKQRIY